MFPLGNQSLLVQNSPYAIICLSPVFTVFYNADMAGTLHGVVVIE